MYYRDGAHASCGFKSHRVLGFFFFFFQFLLYLFLLSFTGGVSFINSLKGGASLTVCCERNIIKTDAQLSCLGWNRLNKLRLGKKASSAQPPTWIRRCALARCRRRRPPPPPTSASASWSPSGRSSAWNLTRRKKVAQWIKKRPNWLRKWPNRLRKWPNWLRKWPNGLKSCPTDLESCEPQGLIYIYLSLEMWAHLELLKMAFTLLRFNYLIHES